MTRIDVAGTSYEWIDDWAVLPDPDESRAAWPHSAIVWSPRRTLYTFHPARRELVAFAPDGRFLKAVPVSVEEAHGITLVEEQGHEYLWLADASGKRRPEVDYRPSETASMSTVVKVGTDGEPVLTLPPPPRPEYRNGPYKPTWVAVNEERFGGNGDVWVSDGYGQSLIHRYSADGRYLSTLTGEEGGGRFRGPHLAFVDRRRPEPELYVADRGNSRIQVFDLQGRFRRVVGAGTLSSPTAFATDGDRLIVLEYFPARMAVLNREDRLIALAGENPHPIAQPGFPFVRGTDGRPTSPLKAGAGRFGVPHSVAIDNEGDLYFTEVAIGSRFTKMRKLSSA